MRFRSSGPENLRPGRPPRLASDGACCVRPAVEQGLVGNDHGDPDQKPLGYHAQLMASKPTIGVHPLSIRRNDRTAHRHRAGSTRHIAQIWPMVGTMLGMYWLCTDDGIGGRWCDREPRWRIVMVADRLRDLLAELVEDDSAPVSVRTEIRESWRRSVQAGLRPDQLDVPFAEALDTDAPLA